MSVDSVTIGIDDTDSKERMCTTYVGVLALRALEGRGCMRIGHPKLVRLNPNCPFKTRGNAAVAFSVKLNGLTPSEAVEDVIRIVEENADISAEGTDPGVVALPMQQNEELRGFYLRALKEIVEIEEAKRLCERYALSYHYFKSGRGLIGALAAASVDSSHLLTYELLAYRARRFWGTERRVSKESVIRMDLATRPFTFDNYDYEKKTVRITPHTPCPVLLGIRGTSDEVLHRALEMLVVDEPIAFYEVFLTNQATDAHYVNSRISELRDGMSAVIRGWIVGLPRIDVGGHVFVRFTDGSGYVTLAAYEPTLSFRKVVSKLVQGDEVVAFGAVKAKPQGMTLNLEKLLIVRLAEILKLGPPTCNGCGRPGTSNGFGKGYKCRKCKTILSNQPVVHTVKRGLESGMYEVAVSARRHLVRPLTLSLAPHHQHGQGRPDFV